MATTRRHFILSAAVSGVLPALPAVDWLSSKAPPLMVGLGSRIAEDGGCVELARANGYERKGGSIDGDAVVWKASGGTLGPIKYAILIFPEGAIPIPLQEDPILLLDGDTVTLPMKQFRLTLK